MSKPEQAVALHEERSQAVAAAPSETAAILSVIKRAAQNPSVDIDKMERLFEMRERALNRTAREAYDTAFASMQVELPTIDQKGCIVITHKDDASKDLEQRRVIQRTPFAKFEDINDAIKPVLAQHGFGLSFRTGLTSDNRITVTGILSHRGGHREETTMVLQHDSTGSKNAVQAIGSSTSYGRRYTTLALLNITSRARQDRDDDGQAAAGPETITEEQAMDLRDGIDATGSNLAKFLDFFGIEQIGDMPAKRLSEAKSFLARKAVRK